jgi:hypothetical protein
MEPFGTIASASFWSPHSRQVAAIINSSEGRGANWRSYLLAQGGNGFLCGCDLDPDPLTEKLLFAVFS